MSGLGTVKEEANGLGRQHGTASISERPCISTIATTITREEVAFPESICENGETARS